METVTPSLIRHENGGFVEPGGCHWDSPDKWFWMRVMGACGCGSQDTLKKMSVQVLSNCENQGNFEHYESLPHEILLHWMDSIGLTEHGSSVFGSWLTEKGKAVLKNIKELSDNPS